MGAHFELPAIWQLYGSIRHHTAVTGNTALTGNPSQHGHGSSGSGPDCGITVGYIAKLRCTFQEYMSHVHISRAASLEHTDDMSQESEMPGPGPILRV